MQHELDALVRKICKEYALPESHVRHIVRLYSRFACDKIEERIGFHSENAKRAIAVLEELSS